MQIPYHRLVSNSRISSCRQAVLRCASNPSSSSTSWSQHATLPGGFNADGLREWAVLTDFGADGHEKLTGQEMRRRRRQMEDDTAKQPYVDLFSKRVSDECSQYLAQHSSPSDVLGCAFFGSQHFMGEQMFLQTLNSLLSLYPKNAITLPTQFKTNDQYLQWKVAMKAPLELICSYQIEALNFRGCTMLAYDPSLRKAYHGNCIDVAENRINNGLIPTIGIQMHVKYAEFLLEGMINELEKISKVDVK